MNEKIIAKEIIKLQTIKEVREDLLGLHKIRELNELSRGGDIWTIINWIDNGNINTSMLKKAINILNETDIKYLKIGFYQSILNKLEIYYADVDKAAFLKVINVNYCSIKFEELSFKFDKEIDLSDQNTQVEIAASLFFINNLYEMYLKILSKIEEDLKI